MNQVIIKEYCPLIGCQRSADLYTGLWLAGQVYTDIVKYKFHAIMQRREKREIGQKEKGQ